MATSPAASPSSDWSSDWQDPATVETMLDDLETWAVVGLSGNRRRTAYDIAVLLQERGKRVVPIHPVFADPDAPLVLWFQLGVVDEDAFLRTTAAGVAMVMDTCPAIEWRKRGR